MDQNGGCGSHGVVAEADEEDVRRGQEPADAFQVRCNASMHTSGCCRAWRAAPGGDFIAPSVSCTRA